TVEADSSKIVEIVEADKIEAGPSQIVAKTTLEIPEILGEIAINLSPKDFLTLLLVNKSIKDKLEFHFFNYQNMWRNYFHRLFPKRLSKQEIYFLYSYKKCIHCDKEFDDPVIIFELKIKICRNCIVLALLSRRDFEETYPLDNATPFIKNKIIKAINTVDFQQLQGSYLHFDFRNHPDLSHLLFYFKKDVESFVKEFNQIPNNLINGWLEEKSCIVHEYQKNVLKLKHPLINDQNIEMMLSRAAFHVPLEYRLRDNLNTIFSYISK
ncbi:19539_t:CDS:2, partial [Racocetra persica]